MSFLGVVFIGILVVILLPIIVTVIGAILEIVLLLFGNLLFGGISIAFALFDLFFPQKLFKKFQRLCRKQKHQVYGTLGVVFVFGIIILLAYLSRPR